MTFCPIHGTCNNTICACRSNVYNPNFKNERQEKAWVATNLIKTVLYQNLQKEIFDREKEIRTGQANLAFQKDLLRSYLAIAGMK